MGAAENIQTIKSVYEAFGRGDVEAILATVTDDVDWATETTSDGAPWYGMRTGKSGVASFFEDFGKTMDVEHFEPLAFAADGDDVMTVVRFVARLEGDGPQRLDGPPPLVPLPRREDRPLPGHRGHRDHRRHPGVTV